MAKTFKPALRQKLYLLVAISAIMIAVQLVNAATQGQLAREWGLWPRHQSGLTGILFAPWLHSTWTHLWSNLPILLVLSALAIWDSTRRYVQISIFIILTSGLLVWFFGRGSIHVGASGWIFGLWAWLVVRALFHRSLANIIIAICVLLLYGGLWWGLLPKAGISMESHIAGMLCGALAAWGFRGK